MFDPHGWSEDSYYEALGKFCLKLNLTFQLIWIKLITSVKPFVCYSLHSQSSEGRDGQAGKSQKGKDQG